MQASTQHKDNRLEHDSAYVLRQLNEHSPPASATMALIRHEIPLSRKLSFAVAGGNQWNIAPFTIAQTAAQLSSWGTVTVTVIMNGIFAK